MTELHTKASSRRNELLEDKEKVDLVKQIINITNASEDEALFALYDSNFELAVAIDLLMRTQQDAGEQVLKKSGRRKNKSSTRDSSAGPSAESSKIDSFPASGTWGEAEETSSKTRGSRRSRPHGANSLRHSDDPVKPLMDEIYSPPEGFDAGSWPPSSMKDSAPRGRGRGRGSIGARGGGSRMNSDRGDSVMSWSSHGNTDDFSSSFVVGTFDANFVKNGEIGDEQNHDPPRDGRGHFRGRGQSRGFSGRGGGSENRGRPGRGRRGGIANHDTWLAESWDTNKDGDWRGKEFTPTVVEEVASPSENEQQSPLVNGPECVPHLPSPNLPSNQSRELPDIHSHQGSGSNNLLLQLLGQQSAKDTAGMPQLSQKQSSQEATRSENLASSHAPSVPRPEQAAAGLSNMTIESQDSTVRNTEPPPGFSSSLEFGRPPSYSDGTDSYSSKQPLKVSGPVKYSGPVELPSPVSSFAVNAPINFGEVDQFLLSRSNQRHEQNGGMDSRMKAQLFGVSMPSAPPSNATSNLQFFSHQFAGQQGDGKMNEVDSTRSVNSGQGAVSPEGQAFRGANLSRYGVSSGSPAKSAGLPPRSMASAGPQSQPSPPSQNRMGQRQQPPVSSPAQNQQQNKQYMPVQQPQAITPSESFGDAGHPSSTTGNGPSAEQTSTGGGKQPQQPTSQANGGPTNPISATSRNQSVTGGGGAGSQSQVNSAANTTFMPYNTMLGFMSPDQLMDARYAAGMSGEVNQLHSSPQQQQHQQQSDMSSYNLSVSGDKYGGHVRADDNSSPAHHPQQTMPFLFAPPYAATNFGAATGANQQGAPAAFYNHAQLQNLFQNPASFLHNNAYSQLAASLALQQQNAAAASKSSPAGQHYGGAANGPTGGNYGALQGMQQQDYGDFSGNKYSSGRGQAGSGGMSSYRSQPSNAMTQSKSSAMYGTQSAGDFSSVYSKDKSNASVMGNTPPPFGQAAPQSHYQMNAAAVVASAAAAGGGQPTSLGGGTNSYMYPSQHMVSPQFMAAAAAQRHPSGGGAKPVGAGKMQNYSSMSAGGGGGGNPQSGQYAWS